MVKTMVNILQELSYDSIISGITYYVSRYGGDIKIETNKLTYMSPLSGYFRVSGKDITFVARPWIFR